MIVIVIVVYAVYQVVFKFYLPLLTVIVIVIVVYAALLIVDSVSKSLLPDCEEGRHCQTWSSGKNGVIALNRFNTDLFDPNAKDPADQKVL